MDEYAEGQARAAALSIDTLRAVAARYDREADLVVISLANGCYFSFPPSLGQGLRGASAAALEEVEVVPPGDGLHWETLDADLHVEFLLAGVFGNRAWMAESLGRAGGQVRSAAKARSSRANGMKGGRPRKTAPKRK